jgi:hypothetical protein
MMDIEMKLDVRKADGEPPLPLWERVGVRGYGLSMERNPSPAAHLAMRVDLSHKGRGGTELVAPGSARLFSD